MAWLLGYRQTKEAATEKPNLRQPRHISTLPRAPIRSPIFLEFKLIQIDSPYNAPGECASRPPPRRAKQLKGHFAPTGGGT
jgi:hypothetical protein